MKDKTKRIIILLAAILILGIVGTYVYQRAYLYASKPIVDYGTDVDINDYLSTDVALPSITVIDIIYQFQDEYDFYMKNSDELMDFKKAMDKLDSTSKYRLSKEDNKVIIIEEDE